MGISTSRLCDRRAYRGRIDGEYRMRASSVASRSRTRGWRTATGPMPVSIAASGRWAWRTTRCWPVSVLRSVCFARNSATSASTAWVSMARAPRRKISVRESVKTPGWVSLITLLSDTAYHSFIGEVEALNTTTIRRLTRSRRHQLLAIAQVDDIRWLIEDAARQFIKKPTYTNGEDAARPNGEWTGQARRAFDGIADHADNSRSARGMRKLASLYHQGVVDTYEEGKARLLRDDDSGIIDWMREKGLPNGERELRRIWKKIIKTPRDWDRIQP